MILIVIWGKFCTTLQISVHKTVNDNYWSTEYPVIGWLALNIIFLFLIVICTMITDFICLLILEVFDQALLEVSLTSLTGIIYSIIALLVVYQSAINPVCDFAGSCIRTLKETNYDGTAQIRHIHFTSAIVYALMIAKLVYDFISDLPLIGS